ncbi:hypothetical protein OF376_03115, partial [Ureaplasma miroungigenitalium]
MKQKQKRIWGLVLAPISLTALITPIISSCADKNNKTTKQDITPQDFEKVKADYKAHLIKLGLDKETAEVLGAPWLKLVDEMYNNAKNDIEKQAAIQLLKKLIEEENVKQLVDIPIYNEPGKIDNEHNETPDAPNVPSTTLTRNEIIDQILARKGEQKKYGELNNVDAFYWARFWNSPFEQIRNLAKGLDEAIDLNKSSTFKPLIDKGLYEKTFLAEAEKQIAN